MFGKTEDQNGYETPQARGNCLEVTAGSYYGTGVLPVAKARSALARTSALSFENAIPIALKSGL